MKPNFTLIVMTSLLVMGGAYWYFSTGIGSDPALTVNISGNEAQTKFKTLISELPSSFDTSIFSDARFNVLVDLTTEISPESPGRLDPFAPVEGIGGTE